MVAVTVMSPIGFRFIATMVIVVFWMSKAVNQRAYFVYPSF